MSKLNAAQIEDLGQKLIAIAAVFNPASAAVVAGIVGAATELNTIVHDIKSQTEANAQDVWNEVSKDYGDSLAAFQASVEQYAG